MSKFKRRSQPIDVKAAAAVLMSTHLLGVAERLCQRIIIMDRGRICSDLAGDALETLLAEGPGALEALYLDVVTDPDVEA